MAARGQLSPVVIAVLALLAEEPMHAYRMQQLIRERGVGMVVNVRNRSGLHAAVERLARDGFIRVRAVERNARNPERTIYEITPPGRDALLGGLRDNVAAPAPEFPMFPAVVSFLHLLSPADAQRQLQRRTEALQRRLDATQALITASAAYGIDRIHLLEHEYNRAVTETELAWAAAVCQDIDSGTLTWQPLT